MQSNEWFVHMIDEKGCSSTEQQAYRKGVVFRSLLWPQHDNDVIDGLGADYNRQNPVAVEVGGCCLMTPFPSKLQEIHKFLD